MRKFIFYVLILTSISAKAQKLEFGLSAGTGLPYIFENFDKDETINYGTPLSLITDLKYTPVNSNWGLKLRFHCMQLGIYDQHFEDGNGGFITLDGYIKTFTTFLLLEKEVLKDKSCLGYNFGLGYTNENFQQDIDDPWNFTDSKYPSITFGGHYTFNLNKNINFQVLPMLIVQNPYRSISGILGLSDRTVSREDLSLLVNFGIRYNLLKTLQQP